MIEITITGINDAVKKLGSISESLLGVATTASYEAATSVILPKIQSMTTKQYEADIDVTTGRVDIIPSISNFEFTKESEKRKAQFMWREYRHPYWKEVQAIIGKGWPDKNDMEQVVYNSLAEIKDIIVGKIKDLVRIS